MMPLDLDFPDNKSWIDKCQRQIRTEVPTGDDGAVRVNETDTFGDDEERDEYFDFEDISEI